MNAQSCLKDVHRVAALPLLLFLSFLMGVAMSMHLRAAQDSDNSPGGGFNVEVEMVHRIVIPKILYFRLGSGNAIDEVTFDLSSNPFTPGASTQTNSSILLGDFTPISATSNGVLMVDLRANVGTVNLSYTVDDINGLDAGGGRFLPYSQIETQASNAGLPAPALLNAGAAPNSMESVDIPGNEFGGRVVNQQGTWTYVYLNQLTPRAGDYKGGVTYTASAP